ncbi:MAG: tryptophan synthase subunit alpha [Oscillospiraceae bacterium]|nr:tryptophan synthase subunit alpha [Oscillospiraceae bacterium]
MNNRIETTIKKAQSEGHVAFIGLVPIDPYSMSKTRETADLMIESGVDIVMVHIPNWIPWMEGGVLQRAAMEPRNSGVTRESIFDFIRELREAYPKVPLIDMTLYDTVMTMGQEKFLELSEKAGVDGFDLPNYPLISTDDKFGFYEKCIESNKHLILAISYEVATAEEGTDEYRMLLEMARKARGFAFIMNAPGGQSGSNVKLTDEQLSAAVTRVKSIMKKQGNECYISIVCGISGKDDIEKVKRSGAECFMIGSAYIKYLQDGKSKEEVSAYLKDIRAMCDYKAR